jgi:hypothetical protein
MNSDIFGGTQGMPMSAGEPMPGDKFHGMPMPGNMFTGMPMFGGMPVHDDKFAGMFRDNGLMHPHQRPVFSDMHVLKALAPHAAYHCKIFLQVPICSNYL